MFLTFFQFVDNPIFGNLQFPQRKLIFLLQVQQLQLYSFFILKVSLLHLIHFSILLLQFSSIVIPNTLHISVVFPLQTHNHVLVLHLLSQHFLFKGHHSFLLHFTLSFVHLLNRVDVLILPMLELFEHIFCLLLLLYFVCGHALVLFVCEIDLSLVFFFELQDSMLVAVFLFLHFDGMVGNQNIEPALDLLNLIEKGKNLIFLDGHQILT
jgi:hypothetical protein